MFCGGLLFCFCHWKWHSCRQSERVEGGSQAICVRGMGTRENSQGRNTYIYIYILYLILYLILVVFLFIWYCIWYWIRAHGRIVALVMTTIYNIYIYLLYIVVITGATIQSWALIQYQITSIGNPIEEISWLQDRLISTVGISCSSKMTFLFWINPQVPCSYHRQTSNIRHTSEGNTIIDHSDAVGAAPVGLLQLHLHSRPGFSGLGKDNCKTRQRSFKLWDLVRLILEILLIWRLGTGRLNLPAGIRCVNDLQWLAMDKRVPEYML